MPQEKMVYGTEEAVARLIMEILRTQPSKVKLLTDLSDEEVQVLSLLSTMGEKLGIDVLKKFCINFCQYRVSMNRKGRKEFVKIATYTTGEVEVSKRKKGIKDLFAGLT
ncbi:MAG: hypothetical protein ACE5KE_00255 [Methanosarcinales archaeon]